MSEWELKPCPFCGGTNLYIDGYQHTAVQRWRVVCLDCMATVDPGWVQQKYCAIELWNRRAQPEHIGDVTEMMPLALEDMRAKEDQPDEDNAVWVNEINTDIWIRAILDEDALRGVFAVWHGGKDQSDFYEEDDYGKTWLAYAHKPGGEQT